MPPFLGNMVIEKLMHACWPWAHRERIHMYIAGMHTLLIEICTYTRPLPKYSHYFFVMVDDWYVEYSFSGWLFSCPIHSSVAGTSWWTIWSLLRRETQGMFFCWNCLILRISYAVLQNTPISILHIAKIWKIKRGLI